MRRIPDVSGESLVPFVCDVAEKGSEILTDGWSGYNDLSKCGYKHERVVISDTGDPAHVSMPGVHRVAALVKRWLLSTHQGSVSQKHLEYYLDEYTFRFNRRTSRSRGMLFYRLIQQAVMTSPLPYRQIVERNRNSEGFYRAACVKWIPPNGNFSHDEALCGRMSMSIVFYTLGIVALFQP
jgi:transposase-like protein